MLYEDYGKERPQTKFDDWMKGLNDKRNKEVHKELNDIDDFVDYDKWLTTEVLFTAGLCPHKSRYCIEAIYKCKWKNYG